MALSHFVIFSLLSAAAFAEITTFTACSEVSAEHCAVNEVRITPCKPPKACILKKGHNASISFDFTPNFETSKLKTGVYWPSGSGDIVFAGMTTDDGCALSTCPTVTGTKQTLNYGLYIGKKLPVGFFTIKWKVWNEENVDQMCCFQTNIQLKKS